MIREGSYFLLEDNRNFVHKPPTPIVWISNVGTSDESGLPQIELKYAAGWSGIVVDLDLEESTTKGELELDKLDTPDGSMVFVWVKPLSAYSDEEAETISQALDGFDPNIAETLSEADDEATMQKTIYDICCGDYPS